MNKTDKIKALMADFTKQLERMECQNYLSEEEAREVVKCMYPPAMWDYEHWAEMMEQLGLKTEEDGWYNEWAMWVAMNMMVSDHRETICTMSGVCPENMPEEELVKNVYLFARDSMMDEDGHFDIRKYFDL